jgi:hypothetical protein
MNGAHNVERRWLRRAMVLATVAVAGLFASRAEALSNLVVNGSFDDDRGELYAWKYKYDPAEDKNVGWYTNNHVNVSVVDQEGSQHKVLSLWGDLAILQVPGQGTKVDSDPVPVKPGGQYRFSCLARSTGPDSRIMVEGYKWVPGIKPHDHPKLSELRRCYKFNQLYFGPVQAGYFGGVGRQWQRAEVKIPEKVNSDFQRQALDEIKFLVVHMVAIGGSEGNLYVDEVKIEKIK